jgi:hypothetical protein
MPASHPDPAPAARPAFAPGVLGALVLLAGLALLDADGFLFIRFGVCILAAIVAVFAVQAGHWWWLAGMLPIAVIWNPAWIIDWHGQAWVAAQFVAALVFIAAGVLIRSGRSRA